MEFALHLPINGVSFGQVSMSVLREIYTRGLSPSLFPIGQPDVSSYKIEPEFGEWLNKCLSKAFVSHNRKTPVLKLWHIDGSLESMSEKQVLFTFYELDSPTNVETNTVRNNARVVFSNKSATNVFESLGIPNLATVPLGFDSHHFSVKEKKYYHDDRVVFNLLGKFEKRKHHAKVIKAWIRKYGNNPKFFLNCAIHNPFLIERRPNGEVIDHNGIILNQILEGKKFFNVNFLGFMQQNELYNDFLNQGNIVIAMSGAEGWGLGEFHSLALGKFCVGLNAHAHRDWMTPENSVLVNPSGKTEAYDGVFFHKGKAFNQGNIFDWNEEEFTEACETAVKKYQSEKVNKAGLKLQQVFTYSKTVDGLLKQIELA